MSPSDGRSNSELLHCTTVAARTRLREPGRASVVVTSLSC